MNRFKTQLLALATLFFPFTASAQYTIYPFRTHRLRARAAR